MLYNIMESNKKAKKLREDLQKKLDEKLVCKTCNISKIQCLSCVRPPCCQSEIGGRATQKWAKKSQECKECEAKIKEAVSQGCHDCGEGIPERSGQLCQLGLDVVGLFPSITSKRKRKRK